MKSLLLHPLRSLLTVLGIFIGVASVIWLLAIGEGISREAQEQIEGLGADNIIIRSIKPPERQRRAVGRAGSLRPEATTTSTCSCRRPHDQVGACRSARSAARSPSTAATCDGRLVGCTPEYVEVTRLEIDRGRFLTEADDDDRAELLRARPAASPSGCFPIEDPDRPAACSCSRTRTITRSSACSKYRTPTAAHRRLARRPGFQQRHLHPDHHAAAADRRRSSIPAAAALARRRSSSSLRSRSGSIGRESRTADLVRKSLRIPDDRSREPRVTRGSQAPTDGSYRIAVAAGRGRDRARRAARAGPLTKLMFMVLMGLIAAISLLVGGIGIMNIMLATVTERTREIGIRRALGAKRTHIIMQFLVETISLSVVGGVTGILGGLLCPLIITSVRDLMFDYAPNLMADAARGRPAQPKPQIVLVSMPARLRHLRRRRRRLRHLSRLSAPHRWTPSKPCGTNEHSVSSSTFQVQVASPVNLKLGT